MPSDPLERFERGINAYLEILAGGLPLSRLFLVEVYAAGAVLVDSAIGEAGDIDTSMLILKMPSGALCHIDNSRRTAYGYDERIEVF